MAHAYVDASSSSFFSPSDLTEHYNVEVIICGLKRCVEGHRDETVE